MLEQFWTSSILSWDCCGSCLVVPHVALTLWMNDNALRLREVSALQKLVEEGKVKYLGISEATPDEVRRQALGHANIPALATAGVL